MLSLFLQPHRSPRAVAPSQEGLLRASHGAEWWKEHAAARRSQPWLLDAQQEEGVGVEATQKIDELAAIAGFNRDRSAALLDAASGDMESAMLIHAARASSQPPPPLPTTPTHRRRSP